MPKMPKENIRQFYSKYEPYFSPVAVLIGFVWDSLTLQRIDLLFENLVILAYLSLALLCILYLNAYDARILRGRFFDRITPAIPFVLQVVFGGLFSAFFIFYSRSASILASWPFLLLLLSLVIGNEVFRKRYHRFVFNLSIFFITLFSYSVFALPIFLKKIGTYVFLASGVLSLVVIFLVVVLLYFIVPERVKSSWHLLLSGIGGIFILFNLFYFLNIIPPIPLATKDSGIYHSVERANGRYRVEYEPSQWYELGRDWDNEFRWRPGEPVYNFTSVFAPTDISTQIKHFWYSYDQQEEEWVLRDELSYSMVGGRDGGYRGYSFKHNVEPGQWKVETVTETGQILGSNKFTIVLVDHEPEFEVKIK